ncbi:MAG: IclR family transcriptional regulator [Bacillota bacterium]|nr:MAG: IclR family transcriptional regulator [Bacillota bacterium]
MRSRESGSRTARYPIRAVERAIAIIGILADTPGLSPLGVTEIAGRLGVSKSTAHRLLTTLVDYEVVEKEQTGGRYRLGWALYRIAHRLPHTTGVHAAAQPLMEAASHEIGETVNLAILNRGQMVIIDSWSPSSGIRVSPPKGVPHPLHCAASGKALIVDLSVHELRRLLGPDPLRALTPRTLVTLAALRRDLALSRERGYTLDDEEATDGVRCLGAPIRDFGGGIVAALSVTGPARRLTDARLGDVAVRVRKLSLEVSRKLGYTGASTLQYGLPPGAS